MLTESKKHNSLRPLRVFLCHSSEDKPSVRELYQRLITEGVDPWFDEVDLLAGQDWQLEIQRALRECDAVIVCLSQSASTKTGYIQKEIRFALDVADEQPEGSIFVIPVKLERCDVPERLKRWQWVDLTDEQGFSGLIRALKHRGKVIGISPLLDSRVIDKSLEWITTELVRDALKMLDDIPQLGKHPMIKLKVVRLWIQASDYGEDPIALGSALRYVLNNAIERLKPEGAKSKDRAWYPYLILKGQYLEHKKSEVIARELLLSVRSYYRYKELALDYLREILLIWETESTHLGQQRR